jgi:phosphomannomutase
MLWGSSLRDKWEIDMVRESEETMQCPGERAPVSRAICRTRQRNHYPKCLLCRHRSEEGDGVAATDAKIATPIFRSMGVVGQVPDQINDYVMNKVGLASAQFMRSETPGGVRLVVGCDAREGSRTLTRVFCAGVAKGGMNVVNLGPVPPELAAFVLGTQKCTGAAYIGAGSRGLRVNGLRLWRGDGAPIGFGTGLEKIGLIARRLRSSRSRLPGDVQPGAAMDEYVAYVRKFAPTPSPLKLVIHAGHGTAVRTLTPLLKGLPLQVTRIGHEQNEKAAHLGKRFPVPEVVTEVAAKMREVKAHLGVLMDFTGERVMFLDERARLLSPDAAAGVIAGELLARVPDATIVYDLRASRALKTLISEAGGTAVAAPTSALGLAGQFRRADALYAADMTGLHYFKNFFRFPSPMVALLLVCAHMSRTGGVLSELTAQVDAYEQSGEITIETASPEVAQIVLSVVRDAFPGTERELIDGVTITDDDWWFNLRGRGKSGELRLNVEARDSRTLRKARQSIERTIRDAQSKA